METLTLTIKGIRDACLAVYDSAVLNTLWSVVLAVIIWLIGDISGAVLALLTLMVLDVISRIFSTSEQMAEEHEISLFSGFLYAWRTERLQSKKLATGVIAKFCAYGIGLMMANSLRYGLHDLSIFGYALAALPRDIVLSLLCITEAASICENLDECGYKVFGKLGLKFQSQADKLTK